MKLMGWLMRVPVLGTVLASVTLWQLGLSRFRRREAKGEALMHPVHPPLRQLSKTDARRTLKVFFELQTGKETGCAPNRNHSFSVEETADTKLQSAAASGSSGSRRTHKFVPETVQDFHNAYLQGRTTPYKVAQRLLDVIRSMEESAVPLRPLLMWDGQELLRQAEASSERFAKGKSLGLLDGVPVAVKDELDLMPYKTMAGTRFYGLHPPEVDASAAAKLRAAGGLMIGKSNMHELGMGVTGMNPQCGAARNPHNPDYYPGGSSSGSAVAVAAGLCPLALGLDGGGSIRIPASLSGVVGLKTTWGRVSRAGSVPLSWSVSTVGPMAATIRDAAIGYALISGPDSRDHWSLNQPPVHLSDFFNDDLEGVRIGWFPAWVNDANPEVSHTVQAMFEVFRQAGAKIVEVEIPSLDAVHVSLLVTISVEMLSSLESFSVRWRSPLGLENFLNLRFAGRLRAEDYVRAQRVRAEAIHKFSHVFEEVDALITPTTARTAPPILADSLAVGEADLRTQHELMKFVTPANLTGMPAISLPAGYDGNGLPIGIQLMGRPWDEALLLRLAQAAETGVARRAPMLHYSLLHEPSPASN